MLTDEQAGARAGRIGSSDVAAVLGLSPFASAYDVWRRLVFGALPSPETNRMRRGSVLERSIIEIAAHELGRTIAAYPSPSVIGGQGNELPEWFVDHTDAVLDDGSLVEAKAYSYTDGKLPESVRLQALWHLAAHPKAPRCHAVIFIHVGDVHYHVVERDDAEISRILKVVGDWYERYVVTETPPPRPTDVAAGVAAYKAVTSGGDGDVLDADDYSTPDGKPLSDVCAAYAEVTARIAELEQEAESLKNIIANFLADQGAVKLFSRYGKWSVISSRRTDWQSVAKALNPSQDLIKQHTRPVDAIRYWRMI